MTEAERTEMLTTARRHYLAGQTVLPMLERKRKLAFEKLLGEYRNGGRNYEPLVAELVVIDSMEREYTIQEQILKTLEEKPK